MMNNGTMTGLWVTAMNASSEAAPMWLIVLAIVLCAAAVIGLIVFVVCLFWYDIKEFFKEKFSKKRKK